MVKFWITSDSHFGHKNIIKYCNRPFNSIRHMNGYMINAWNKKVSKKDIVFHLGDFAFKGKAKEIRKKLNGNIILVRGNHDKNLMANEGFKIVEGSMKFGKFIFSHHPLPPEEIPKGFTNIHGHIHDKESVNGINVSVEKTRYFPRRIRTNEVIVF